ncbi:hypothetical protein HOT99_gp175 [Caulobacter phage CcrBL10]|uniref:Uncharacterized protein n=1 Tax=Caulobacter phage CcrBL10 TaxID=2283269 RepID=A0A385EC52_9CAUD|nr:hypothetical protein HOT99_gp175 [Caulobacter phage CcrBL10]AXQ68442.1 hypothetical protein CcrBL10_gp238 [Caulobacter phage CcrBL10]
MSRRYTGPRFWIAEDGHVHQIQDGVTNVVATLTKDEMSRLRKCGWNIGSSTRRYAHNPATVLRNALGAAR